MLKNFGFRKKPLIKLIITFLVSKIANAIERNKVILARVFINVSERV